jgi:hypothetical protein
MSPNRQWFVESLTIGATVSFSNEYRGTWKLTELLHQKVWERTKQEEELYGNGPHARGIFRCTKLDQPGKGREGQIRIWMQYRIHLQALAMVFYCITIALTKCPIYRIPLTGTEHLPAEMRKSQKEIATGDLAETELCMYKILRASNYEYTPTILGFDERLQGDDEPVPGG